MSIWTLVLLCLFTQVNLRHFRRGRRRSLALVAHTGYLPHQQDPHHVHRNTPLHANALCHFHIAASINPATGNKALFKMFLKSSILILITNKLQLGKKIGGDFLS